MFARGAYPSNLWQTNLDKAELFSYECAQCEVLDKAWGVPNYPGKSHDLKNCKASPLKIKKYKYTR